MTITVAAVHEAAAEPLLALLLAFSKQIVVRDRPTPSGHWPRDLVEPIRGKTIGMIGLGNIESIGPIDRTRFELDRA